MLELRDLARGQPTLERNVEGVVLMLIDIDAIQRGEDALIESEARFALLANDAPVLIWVSDPDEILYANRALIDFLGADPSLTRFEWARLIHPQVVRERLTAATGRALARIGTAQAKPMRLTNPIRVRLRLDDVTKPQILEAIPGVKQVDGYTVEFTAPNMAHAYRLIRLMYRFVTI